MKRCPWIVIAFAAASAIAQEPLAPRVAPDVSKFVTPDQLKTLDRMLAPHVEQAQKTFPAVEARFLAGLPKGQFLFATARLYDECGRSELAFISVTGIQGGIVEGRIWSVPKVVTFQRFRDRYAFPKEQLVDWLIVNPDGTEEGNVAGKLMGGK